MRQEWELGSLTSIGNYVTIDTGLELVAVEILNVGSCGSQCIKVN
jgi:hypothetical protein